jgi:hypothetical protein
MPANKRKCLDCKTSIRADKPEYVVRCISCYINHKKKAQASKYTRKNWERVYTCLDCETDLLTQDTGSWKRPGKYAIANWSVRCLPCHRAHTRKQATYSHTCEHCMLRCARPGTCHDCREFGVYELPAEPEEEEDEAASTDDATGR